MLNVDKLYVKYHDQLVGTLMMSPDSESAVFQYADEWLVTGFSISPLELPLQNQLFIAPRTPFYGNFGKWRLSPAYDLLPFVEGYHGQHATSVMGQGSPTEKDMIAAGESIRINAKRAKQIIEEMKGCIPQKL